MKIEVLIYPTTNGVSRMEYKNHVIQTYGYDDGTPDLTLTHLIIDEFGNDLVGKDCLLKCIAYIDRRAKNDH